MGTTKFLIPLFFLGFLAGCATPCPPPGQPNLSNKMCNYAVKIADVDPQKRLVFATIPERVLAGNKASGKTEDEHYNLDNYPRETVYTFRVDDLGGINKDEILEFRRAPDTVFNSYNNKLERHKTPCPAPDEPNLSVGNCTYQLLITGVDSHKLQIRGKVPKSVKEANKKSSEMGNKESANYQNDTEYTFFVHDLFGIELGKVMEFHKAYGNMTNTLEPGSRY